MKTTLLEKFLKYISIDTTSDSSKEDTPSTPSQKELAKLLVNELEEIGLDKIHYDEKNCYVYATLKGIKELPKIGFISHMDTSEDAPGSNINHKIINNYDGKDITLNESVILSPKDYPSLNKHVGKTLITTSGDTLLGADNKAGIAEIMTLLEYFTNENDNHGDICVCFTPDEEIGLGTLHFDKNHFDVDFAYTVDGGALGEFSYENFNAATAIINVTGISTHCGSAKGKMVNASKLAIAINSLIPTDEVPEKTENYEGFFHLDEMKGTVSKATLKYLIRDFDKDNFEKRKEVITKIVNSINEKYGNCVELTIKNSYRNMLSVIEKQPALIEGTKKAISSLGLTPDISPIRGGTDGTEISYKGIPCPNLGVGAYNFHSVYEYACLEEMEETSKLLVAIVKQFSKEYTKTSKR